MFLECFPKSICFAVCIAFFQSRSCSVDFVSSYSNGVFFWSCYILTVSLMVMLHSCHVIVHPVTFLQCYFLSCYCNVIVHLVTFLQRYSHPLTTLLILIGRGLPVYDCSMVSWPWRAMMEALVHILS